MDPNIIGKAIWDIFSGIIKAFGGFTLAFVTLSKFLGTKFVDALMEKYKLIQEKRLERYRAELENKKFVTQKRYDKIFEIYEVLTADFYEAIELIEDLIPADRVLKSFNEQKDISAHMQQNYSKLKSANVKAKKTFYRYMPFIEKSLSDEYKELLNMLNKQVNSYANLIQHSRADLLEDEDYERTKQINTAYEQLNTHIRDYLHQLELIQ